VRSPYRRTTTQAGKPAVASQGHLSRGVPEPFLAKNGQNGISSQLLVRGPLSVYTQLYVLSYWCMALGMFTLFVDDSSAMPRSAVGLVRGGPGHQLRSVRAAAESAVRWLKFSAPFVHRTYFSLANPCSQMALLGLGLIPVP
jgi:hypothetical protein